MLKNYSTKIDTAFLGIIIIPVLPVLFMLTGWWGSLPFVAETDIWKYLLAGLFLGVTLDIVFLPKIIRKGFFIPQSVMVLIYIFYSVGLFGFFMGVPVMNIIPGLFAGYYASRKGNLTGNKLKHVLLFINSVLIIICMAAAYIALRDPFTAANLEGMFSLGFELQNWHLYMIVIIGGSLLLLLQTYLYRAGRCLAARVAG